MRYIGSKANILDSIIREIGRLPVQTAIDVFAGSGAVAECLAASGTTVYSNDMLYFAFILNKGKIELTEKPLFSNLPISDPIEYLNALTFEASGLDAEDCFVWKHYAPHDGCARMYFQEDNALKIDMVRLIVERWRQSSYLSDDEYFYLLSRLLEAVPYVSNIAGVYAAYLKYWDKRAFKRLTLCDKADWMKYKGDNRVFNMDYKDLLQMVSADLLYADPPYNNRQYLPNYHLLETIARYDRPAIHGISGMRAYGAAEKSDFCVASRAPSAFESLIERADVNYLVLSYNDEGIVPTEILSELCQSYARPGTFRLVEIPYRKYKCHGGGGNHVKEQLYIFRKK